MDAGELLTRWSIRGALLFYVAALAAILLQRNRRFDSASSDSMARLLWTLGCLSYLFHVLGAFLFFHDLSHDAAYRDTARQTKELLGWDWGGGLYFNYLFTAAWLADVLYWWLAPARRRARPRVIGIALHAFLAFIALNATVVFETGPIRWAGAAACAALAAIWWAGRRRRLRIAY